MRLTWREELFNPKTAITQLAFPLSSAHAAKILGVCFRTIKRWDDAASIIPEYKLSRVQMKKRSEEWGGKTPMSPYQVWVMGKVGEIYSGLPNGYPKKSMTQTCIKAKASEYTREEYAKEQQRFAELALVTKE